MARGASSARKDKITRTKVSTGANTGGVSTSKTPYWNKAKVKDLLNQGAKIVNRSEDILEQAMKTFEALNPKGDMDYTATVNFLSTLNRDGLLPTKLIDGKYQVPQMKELILDIR